MADPVAASSAASDRSILSRRKDRDLWISRGHLRAATVGVILVAVCSFALGYAVGKSSDDDSAVVRGGVMADVPVTSW